MGVPNRGEIWLVDLGPSLVMTGTENGACRVNS
jgi:mRNA-degrading endonuclease toxin of MazEF toxin-antitoxin module